MTHSATQIPNLNAAIIDITPEQLRREMEHEQSMIEIGRVAAQNRLAAEKARGNASVTAGGRALISGLSLALAERIVAKIAELEDGRVKRKPPEVRTLQLLPARDMAVIAIRSVTNSMASREPDKCTPQVLGFAIGSEVEDEHFARLFRQSDRGLFDLIVRRVNERSKNRAQRRKELMEAYARVEEDPAPRMTDVEKKRMGVFLLAEMEGIGLLQSFTTRKRGNRTIRLYQLTEAALETLTKVDEMSLEMQPSLAPTLIPPRDWVSLRSGGYWKPMAGGQRMVVARNRSNGIRQATEDDMPGVFGPINYLQSVPFRINQAVLAVVLRMRERNMALAGLPPSELEAIPPKPHDIETNEEARTLWKVQAKEAYTRNATAKGRILACHKVVTTAKALADEPAIYFPKFLDFRGRVYDAPSGLKPQGDDLSKGLLEFAHGKPLDDVGAWWLAVHGANVYGEDKCSLDDRVEWVEANSAQIAAVAADPFAERFWMTADKPFQFLAFCVDWAGFLEHGYGYLSHTPVAMDGSCNGLQHLSAMLKDEIGGAAVNLVPAELPADIYTQVMERVVAMLEERRDLGEPTAQKWLPLMKRKTVKRPVMTLPYGATKQGFAD